MGNRKCRLEPAGLCGTSIDTENVIFGDREPNLVYMDKVFSFNSDTSCPVFFLDTRCDSDNFEIKFTTADRDAVVAQSLRNWTAMQSLRLKKLLRCSILSA